MEDRKGEDVNRGPILHIGMSGHADSHYADGSIGVGRLTDHACAHSPACLEDVLPLARLCQVLGVERLSKVGAQVV